MDNPSVGCILLAESFFFSETNWIPIPSDFFSRISNSFSESTPGQATPPATLTRAPKIREPACPKRNVFEQPWRIESRPKKILDTKRIATLRKFQLSGKAPLFREHIAGETDSSAAS